MPVTARSKAFYDQLGEQVANELVDWFNQVDLTYRTELRELNDLNFARFDAKIGERLAELRAEMDKRFVEARSETESRFAKLEVAMTDRFASLGKELEASKTSLVRWMFAFWIMTASAILGSRLAQ
jgi:hypothetical protein